jgi:glycosyltransferase involved in cell wall biosynthesis
MATFLRSTILRVSLYLVGPALTLAFGWGVTSVSLSAALAMTAILLHLYYRNIYVRLPVFLLRVATFTVIQLILAASIRSPGSGGLWSEANLAVIPKFQAAEEVPMQGKVSSDFLSSQPIVTMSIVLPCANEGEFSWKTADAIASMTDDDILHEIIVVDDGSTPPLSTQFPAEIVERAKVKFVRHEHHTGLINAKAAGANIATGDIVVFLDCHVKPAPGWEHPIVEKIRTNYRRVVVPSITALDPDTWEEIRGNGGTAKCYLTWDSDFKWFDSDDEYVAVMSGGLLAMSRQWWTETGGYDRSMQGWGGENIDQSLRIWLCNGEIVQATDSFVGHMWRSHDAKTKAKYTVPAGSVTKNRYKGAAVWMGEWSEKLETFPAFSPFKNKAPDMTSIQTVKDRLNCRHFSYFIDRFYKVYHWGGYLPQFVFHLRDAVSGMCIQRRGESLLITECSDDDPGQLWHKSNRDGDKCCSGYRNWNSDQCMSGNWVGSKGRTIVCNIGGYHRDQFIQLNPETSQIESTNQKGACLGGKMPERQKAEFAKCLDSGSFRQMFKTVPVDEASPETRKIYRLEDAERRGLCLAALGGTEPGLGRVEVHDCDESSLLQTFELEELENGETRLKAIALKSDSYLCFDAGLGTSQIGLYPCYSDVNGNQNVVVVRKDAETVKLMFKGNNCVSISNTAQGQSNLDLPIGLYGCVVTKGRVKRGQNFEKVFPDATNTSIFALKNKDGHCLSIKDSHLVLAADACEKSLFKQDSEDPKKRLVHVATNMCLDGGGEKSTAILYSCYDGDNLNQQWDTTGGSVKGGRGPSCLDFEPSASSEVSMVPCSLAETTFKWEEYNPFVPIETKLYKQYKEEHPDPEN